MELFAKGGGGGGGHASAGGRGSVGGRASVSARPGTSTGGSFAKPGSKITMSTGKTVTSSAAKPSNKAYNTSKGVIGPDYTPSFKSGYKAPEGSVVYYHDGGGSALDWLPWYYLASHDGNQQVTVVQPDGKQVQQTEEGGDGMYAWNMFLMIVIVGAVIFGICYGVYRFAIRNEPSYGW